jgi:hypothetical protein
MLGVDTSLLGELEVERLVDLDPAPEIELLQPDLEKLRRAVIWRVDGERFYHV